MEGETRGTAEKPSPEVYLAQVWAQGRVAKGEKRKKGEPPPPPFRLLLGEGEASLPLPPKLYGRRMVGYLDKPAIAHFWPRTDEEGLVKELHLVRLSVPLGQGRIASVEGFYDSL